MLRTLFVAVAVFLWFSGTASAQTYTWNLTTGGNWNAANNWLDGGNNPAVPVSGTTAALVFGASGSTSYTATNNIGPFTLNSLTINNTGTGTITIAGSAAANTLTFGGTSPTVNVTGTALFTGLMAGAPTVTMTGTGTFIHDSNNSGFTGTLVINGGTFVNRATTNATTNFNPVSIVVNNGGTYQFGSNTTGDPNLPNSTYVTVNTGGTVNWQEGETFGGFHLQGGTINFQQGGVTSSGSTAQSWTSGTLTGGAFSVGGNTAINKTTSGVVTISGSASIATGTGGLNILDGTVAHASAANLGTANVTLGHADGSTSGTFEYQGLSAARGGTFTLNAGGGAINVTNPSATLTLGGALGGSGNLTKSGPGTLHLAGALNQTGTVTAAEGVLRVNPGTSAGGFAVNSGATLAVNSGAGAASLTAPALDLGPAGSTIRYELAGVSIPTAPLLVVSTPGGLNLNGGTHTLAVASPGGIPTGTFTLIDYSGAPISAGFNLSLPGRTAGSLNYDTTNTLISVTIAGTDTIKWTGAVNNTWDVGGAPGVGGTNNWQLVNAGTPTNFIQTDVVTFDNAASAFTVNIADAVGPSGLTVNNGSGNTYTFQGGGKITGPTSLNKQGAGTLILATDNDYSGGTTVAGGALQLGNGGTSGSITGAVSLAGGTTLAFNRSDPTTFAGAVAAAGNAALVSSGAGVATLSGPVTLGSNNLEVGGSGTLTFSGVISGTGTITKTGAGTVFISDGNSDVFTGTLNVNGGVVEVGNPSGTGTQNFNAAFINVNGGTFKFRGPTGNPNIPANTVITINSGGVAEFTEPEDYGGIVLKGGAYNTSDGHNFTSGVTSVLESGTITGLPGGGGGSLQGAGAIQKTTPGTVTITGVGLNNTGGLAIDEGVLSTDAAIGGSGAFTIGTNGNATLQYRGAAATVSRAVSLAEGGATFDVAQSAAAYTLGGAVSGIGTLTKTGAGTLVLTGNNTYQAGTTVVAGTLLANNAAGSATGTGGVTVAGGGTLGGRGTITPDAGNTVTVQSGGTITAGTAAGTGNTALAIGANGLTVSSGGIYKVSLFGTGATDISLLNVTGSVTIGSGALLRLDLSGLSASDAATLRNDVGVGGTRTYTVVSGTGTVGNFSPANFGIANPGNFDASEWMLVSNPTAGTVQITFAPVPEPATVLAVAAGALGLGGFVRRRLRGRVGVAAAA